LTFQEVPAKTPSREPVKAHEREPRVDEYESLNHTKWECFYHVVFIPKCRRKVLYGQLRKHLGEVLVGWPCRRSAASRKGT